MAAPIAKPRLKIPSSAGAEEASEELRKTPKEVPPPAFGVVVFESRHARDFVHCDFKHEYAKFLLVLDGQARLQGQGRTCFLTANSLMHVPASTFHHYEDLPGQPVSLYCLHYRPEVLPATLNSQLGGLGIVHWKLDRASINLAHSFRSDFQELLFEQMGRREGWELMLRVCLGRLAVRTLRLARRHSGEEEVQFRKGDTSAERVATYAVGLETSFYCSHTVTEAARASGLSRRQFTQVFHQVTGQTWRRYLQKLRLNYAQKMLLQTDNSVIAIAFEAGFETVSNFNRAFKDAFGCTPSAFRQQRRSPAKA